MVISIQPDRGLQPAVITAAAQHRFFFRRADVVIGLLSRYSDPCMMPSHCVRAFLRLGLFLLLLSCACAPRSPAGPGGSSSPMVSPPPTLLAAAGSRQAALQDSAGVRLNPWSDAAREVLVQHCGKCHRGDLPTAVPGAL